MPKEFLCSNSRHGATLIYIQSVQISLIGFKYRAGTWDRLASMVVGCRSGILSLALAALLLPVVSSLQCYGCNILMGAKSVDRGCSNPEVITCSRSQQGFKHRFCMKMESVVLGILLTSGCATSRHCQQQELPGVRIHCCDQDLCNGSPRARLSLCCLLASWILTITFLI